MPELSYKELQRIERIKKSAAYNRPIGELTGDLGRPRMTTTKTISSEGKRDTPLCEECDSIICRACWNKIAVPVPVSSEGDKLESLITDLCDAAFDCGDYNDNDSDEGYQIVSARNERAIEALKRYVTTIRNAERVRVWERAISIATLMAAGETYETGRQKALNIAATLQAAANDEAKGEGHFTQEL